jgi:signal transduction histidine kinase
MSSGSGSKLRLDRLDSLAALAGGVTHELSNLAASVMMSVQLLEPSCSAADDRLVLASLEDLARRLQHAGRQLHWLARGVAGEPTVFQPQYLLADLQKLARVAFPESITVITRYPPDLWPLAGDPLVVFQLLLALCLEARGHLPDGGTLVLAACNEELGAPGQRVPAGGHAALRNALPGRYVVLEAVAELPAGAPGSRRREAAGARRAAAAAGGFTTPLPRGMAGRGRRAYLPASAV